MAAPELLRLLSGCAGGASGAGGAQRRGQVDACQDPNRRHPPAGGRSPDARVGHACMQGWYCGCSRCILSPFHQTWLHPCQSHAACCPLPAAPLGWLSSSRRKWRKCVPARMPLRCPTCRRAATALAAGWCNVHAHRAPVQPKTRLCRRTRAARPHRPLSPFATPPSRSGGRARGSRRCATTWDRLASRARSQRSRLPCCQVGSHAAFTC